MYRYFSIRFSEALRVPVFWNAEWKIWHSQVYTIYNQRENINADGVWVDARSELYPFLCECEAQPEHVFFATNYEYQRVKNGNTKAKIRSVRCPDLDKITISERNERFVVCESIVRHEVPYIGIGE